MTSNPAGSYEETRRRHFSYLPGLNAASRTVHAIEIVKLVFVFLSPVKGMLSDSEFLLGHLR